MAKNKNNVRKKPTAKEMASAIIEINNRTNELLGITRQLDSIFGLYIEMKGDKEQFNAYIGEMQKKHQEEMEATNDAKENGTADNQNLQGDTDGESSGTEGIRQEAK
tara:strand:- start:354 stop:674 length:321 start_codon:yes stop_codon:yes gene_type:complete